MEQFENTNQKLFSNINWNDLLTDIRWISKCAIIKSRDNSKCRNCNSTDRLIVHHMQYHFVCSIGRLKYPWEYPDDVLITLCKKCNAAGYIKYKIPIIDIK